MAEPNKKKSLVEYPGVRSIFAGVVGVVVAIFWTIVQPDSDTPFGGAEILAVVSSLLVIGGAFRGASAIAEDDGRPRDEP